MLTFAEYARSNSTEGLTFRLTDDISLTKSGDDSNWEPSNLSGTLDGGIYDQNGNLIGNHTISNLTINNSSKDQAAFFQSITGTLKNVTLTNLFINGNCNLGTLASTNSGTIQNCAVQGTLTAAFINNSGISVYNNYGTITGCFFDVNFNGNSFGGGNSYDNYTTSGSVAADKKVFRLDFPKGIVPTGNIFSYFGNSYATENTQISFSISDDNDFEKITSVKFNGTDLSADQNGFYSFTTAYEASNVSFEGYPKIEGLDFDAQGNFYKVQDAYDLIALSNYVKAGNKCAGLTFKQTSNIEMAGKTFAPIGNSDIWFAGTFDGGNFSISNLNIDNPDTTCQGLFGKTAKSAVISRINLLNAHITGKSYTGGIVGYNLGTVEDCYVDSDSNIHAIQDCYSHSVIVGQNLTITGNVAVDTANHFARLDGNSYIIVDNADIPNYSDLIQVYVLNLPECVQAEGDILFSSNGTTYAAGDISLNPKIGYLIDDSNVNISKDTNVAAHFDDKNHYVLADDTSTLANETNTADFPDLIQVWKVDGVNLVPADNIYLVGSDITGNELILNAGIYVAHGNLNFGTISCKICSEAIFHG